MDRILIAPRGESGLGSNYNKGITRYTRASELDPHNKMQVSIIPRRRGRNPNGVVANVLNCNIVVNEFELQ